MTRTTIAQQVTVTGTALHAGVHVTMTLSPASSGSGIVFHRSDLGRDIPALFDRVGETRLGTVIAEEDASAGVIEHLMAAVAGEGIDDLLVTLDGPEPPILDGDALAYIHLLDQAGLARQPGRRAAIRVIRPVRVRESQGPHQAEAALLPAPAFTLRCEIRYPGTVIGTQAYDFAFSRQAFRAQIAPARTFGFLAELDHLNRLGLARGASLTNTLALEEEGLVNPQLRRFTDEFARHKVLDAIGDLALAGAPLIGRFEGLRSGHGLNNALLRALFSDPSQYVWEEL